MSYFVSRQAYYYSGESAVEIAAGGLDYSGCDMLVSRYHGEGHSYDDPREAVQVAIDILQAWKTDSPEKEIGLAYGYNLDMIEGETISPEDMQDAKDWAEKEYVSLLKCDRCGDIIPDPKEYYYILEDDSFGKFCSENCADNAYYDYLKDYPELAEEEE